MLTAGHTGDHGKIAITLDMAFTSGLMLDDMKGNGKMEKKMDLACISRKVGSVTLVNGKLGYERNCSCSFFP